MKKKKGKQKSELTPRESEEDFLPKSGTVMKLKKKKDKHAEEGNK